MIRKTIYTLFALTLIIGLIYIYSKPKTDTEKLSWILGSWERLDMPEGKSGAEKWKLRGDHYEGIALNLNGTDTTFIEYIKIAKLDKDHFYIVEVSHNAEPTYFKLTSVTDSSFVCENPKHDFPKKIEYWLKGEEMHAKISGDGNEVGFRFKRKLGS